MKIEDLMWVSVQKFHKLMRWPVRCILKACAGKELIAELVDGPSGRDYRISIVELAIPALEKHFTSIRKDLEAERTCLLLARDLFNEKQYSNMNPCEKRAVNKWLPLMLKFERLKGAKLRRGLSGVDISYNTFIGYRNKWVESGGDIRSFAPKYGRKKRLSSSSSKGPRALKPSSGPVAA